MKTLITERLILRDFVMEDLADFNAYCANENVGINAGWTAHKNIEESKSILERFISEGHTYAIVPKGQNKVVGSVGIEQRNNILTMLLAERGYVGKNVEIGYALAYECWGKGYMTEAVKAVVKYAFEDKKVDYVVVGHFPENERSRRVIEKCGFTFVLSRIKAYERTDGVMMDEQVYCMTRQQYFALEEKKMKNIAVAVVGMCGSGKSVLTEVFEAANWRRVYFGGVTITELKKAGLEINEKNEREMREGLRKEFGMGAFAVKLIDEIKEKLEKGNVVLDGLYSWSEYIILKKELGDKLQMLAVVTNRALRYKRLQNRTVRPLNEEQALSRDFSEIENLEKGGPIAFADHYILNNGTEKELKQKAEDYLKSLR